jgi:hypothetical protein
MLLEPVMPLLMQFNPRWTACEIDDGLSVWSSPLPPAPSFLDILPLIALSL